MTSVTCNRHTLVPGTTLRSYCSSKASLRRIVARSAPTKPSTAASLSAYNLGLQQEVQIELYIDTLLRENQKYNLSAVRDKDLAYDRHVLDSLSLLEPIEQHAGSASAKLRLLDVGSGPGMPGAMLAIARPEWQVRRAAQACWALPARSEELIHCPWYHLAPWACWVPLRHCGVNIVAQDMPLDCTSCRLHSGMRGTCACGWLTAADWHERQATAQVTCLDATRKKAAFIRMAAAEAGIANITALAGRCEDMGHDPQLRESFDVVTARAVAGTRTLVELCLPFVAPGGLLVAAKGPHIQVRAILGAPPFTGRHGVHVLKCGQRWSCSHDAAVGRCTAREAVSTSLIYTGHATAEGLKSSQACAGRASGCHDSDQKSRRQVLAMRDCRFA
jgi:16S rRNA G527 N7-methylase RsmG